MRNKRGCLDSGISRFIYKGHNLKGHNLLSRQIVSCPKLSPGKRSPEKLSLEKVRYGQRYQGRYYGRYPGGIAGRKGQVAGRKGQVTIFIIVGIIVLLLMAVILYVTKTTRVSDVLTEGTPALRDVPRDYLPVQRFTENCMKQIGKTSLRLLGQQGGYLYPDLLGQFSDRQPTESAGITLNPTKVPYWHYNTQHNSENSVSYSTLQPKLYASEDPEMSIEAQLARFMREKLDECLDGYQSFKDQGITVEVTSPKKVTARIGEESVDFTLEMDVKAQKEGSERTLNVFYGRIPLNLKHYYQLASNIAENERNYYFLESQFLSLLGAFAASPDSLLPPLHAVGFDIAPTKFWNMVDISRQVKSLISSYIPLLQIQSAHNVQYYQYGVGTVEDLYAGNYGLYQRNYDTKILPIPGAEDVEIRFDYFGWEPYLDVNDVDGQVRAQDSFFQQEFVMFGMQRYYTTYDVAYPVLVTIDDPLALDGQGYRFMVALEANIKNNDRVVQNEVIITPPPIIQESLACDKDKRDTEIIKTVVVDSWTHEPLEMVRIGFSIPNQDDCFMGLTNEHGEFAEPYPAVYGGIVNIIKNEYLTNFYPIDTYDVREKPSIMGYAVADLKQPVIELHKLKTIHFNVKKKPLGKCVTQIDCSSLEPAEHKQCFFAASGNLLGPQHLQRFIANNSLSKFNDYYFIESPLLDLGSQDKAVITLTKVADINEQQFSAEHVVPLVFQGNETIDFNLVPGVYKVEGSLIYGGALNIPADKRNLEFDGGSDIEYDMPEVNLSSYLNGQLQWLSEPYYLKVTPEALYLHDQLTFIIPSQEIQEFPKNIPAAGGCSNEIASQEKTSRGLVMEDMGLMNVGGNISRWHRAAYEPLWGSVILQGSVISSAIGRSGEQ